MLNNCFLNNVFFLLHPIWVVFKVKTYRIKRWRQHNIEDAKCIHVVIRPALRSITEQKSCSLVAGDIVRHTSGHLCSFIGIRPASVVANTVFILPPAKGTPVELNKVDNYLLFKITYWTYYWRRSVVSYKIWKTNADLFFMFGTSLNNLHLTVVYGSYPE